MLVPMADASGSRLSIGAPVEKRGRGRPHGSKNKATAIALVASSSAPVKRRPGRLAGSKNKIKVPSTTPGPSAPSVMLLLPESIPFSALLARSAGRFSAYR
jgi:hypothetical protein